VTTSFSFELFYSVFCKQSLNYASQSKYHSQLSEKPVLQTVRNT